MSAQGVFAREKLNVHGKHKPTIKKPVFFPHYSMSLELLFYWRLVEFSYYAHHNAISPLLKWQLDKLPDEPNVV